jgi:hypothetical protein
LQKEIKWGGVKPDAKRKVGKPRQREEHGDRDDS